MGNAEQFFLNIRERIVEELRTLTDKEIDDLIEELEKDTDDTVLTFDLCEIMESV